MPKVVKTSIMCAYAYFFIQYLKITLSPVIVDIDIEYRYSSSRITISKREMKSKKYHNVSINLRPYIKPERFKTDLKFVLKYTGAFLHYGTPLSKTGQKPFIDYNCTYQNCYLTTQRNFLNDYRDFDAILFDVENNWEYPIPTRTPYQKFIFLATESAANFPQCHDSFDDFYNLTWTYRLDSDIYWRYFIIADKAGNTVGPKINMTWTEITKPAPLKIKKKIGNKKKAAAWFVSNCNTISDRRNVSRHIEKAMRQYNLTLDVFGWCGRKKCPKDRFKECLYLLENEYYFYFSFENSLCVDYVTEKVLYPLQNYAVPVVFGGADYSRFLPPGSYINARERNATQIVEEMYRAIKNPNVYENYFRWHNYYKYEKNPPKPDICQLCQVLNEEKTSTYKSFRKWWNPEYASICATGGGKLPVRRPPI